MNLVKRPLSSGSVVLPPAGTLKLASLFSRPDGSSAGLDHTAENILKSPQSTDHAEARIILSTLYEASPCL